MVLRGRTRDQTLFDRKTFNAIWISTVLRQIVGVDEKIHDYKDNFISRKVYNDLKKLSKVSGKLNNSGPKLEIYGNTKYWGWK